MTTNSPAKLSEIKNSMLDTLIIIILILGIPNLALAIFNTHEEGHFPIISLTGLLIILFSSIFRNRIHFLVKAWILISFGYFIGTSGLINEGLLSDGVLYYIIIVILSSMLINIRTGIIIMIINMLTSGIISLAISKDWLNYNFDIITYFHSPATWLAFIFMAAFFTSLAVYIYGQLEKYLVHYVNELTLKTEILNKSNLQLAREIEDRELTEHQLIQSEIKFRNVFNSISDGIILLNQDYAMIDINDGMVKMTGFSKESLFNRRFDTLFSDTVKLQHVLDKRQSQASIFNNNEHQVKTTDKNVTIPVEINLLPFQIDPEIIYIAHLKNITDTRENDIRIMNAVISSEEEERLRIARDLHDSVGPYLSAARLYIQSMEFPETDPRSVQIKKELSELMNLSISSIREISGNLGSHILRSLGLRAALNSYIEKINPDGVIKFEVTIPDHYPFVENVEMALYRVLAELIINSVKYGSPDNINIAFSDSPRKITIKYKENGTGFNLQEALGKQKGMGLYNIHSRIQALGGNVDFHSRPGKGVSVNLTFDRAAACQPTA
jgi:PAS domain S-box-containing protein